MILDASKGHHGKLHDANGEYLGPDVFWADTETGEVRKVVRDENGDLQKVRNNAGKVVDICKVSAFYPAPLRLEPERGVSVNAR